MSYGPPVERIADPWTVMAAMAQRHRSDRARPDGHADRPPPSPCSGASRRRRSIASSNGRLVFGVGLGGDRGGELSRFGEEMDPRVRAKMLDDGLEHIDRWWRGEEANGVQCCPPPVQQPRIPDLGRVDVPEPCAGAPGGALGRLVPDRAALA